MSSFPPSPFSKKVTSPVRRDHQWIEREYGREKWPSVLAECERILSTGESRIGAILSQLMQWEHGEATDVPIEILALGQLLGKMPVPSALAGFYNLVISTTIGATNAETHTVLELGAGWGRNLFLVWANGGPNLARYGSLEFTAAGCECARLISQAIPEMQMEPRVFDLRNPDLSAWKSPSGHATVLTVYGIEQAPRIGRELFSEILDLAPSIDVVHFEPVGWQIRGDAEGRSQLGSSKNYAELNDTNMDLWEQIKLFERKGYVDIVSTMPDVYGLNPYNSASLIHWRKRLL